MVVIIINTTVVFRDRPRLIMSRDWWRRCSPVQLIIIMVSNLVAGISFAGWQQVTQATYRNFYMVLCNETKTSASRPEHSVHHYS